MPTRYVPPRFVPTPGVANGIQFTDGPVGIGTSAVAGTPLTLAAGTGTATIAPGGTLTVNTTEASNAANTEEQVLWTYTLPANTLAANGAQLKIEVYFSVAANANNKIVKLYFGNQVLVTRSSTLLNNVKGEMTGWVVRTGAATQVAQGRETDNNAGTVIGSAPTEDTTGNIVIKFTGQSNVAGAANEITFKMATVRLF